MTKQGDKLSEIFEKAWSLGDFEQRWGMELAMSQREDKVGFTQGQGI